MWLLDYGFSIILTFEEKNMSFFIFKLDSNKKK